MIPQTGTYAYFTFASKFDALNGIYQVVQIESFAYARANNVDFVSTTYVGAGLGQTDWDTDYTNYTNDDVYFLQSTDGTSTIYPVPQSMLDGEPDFQVEKFSNLILTVVLGEWSDPTELTWVVNNINETVASATGVTNNAQLYADSASSTWMRLADYNKMAAARKAAVVTLNPRPIQIQELQAQVQSLKTLVTVYENLIASQQTGNT